ncbi:hypothetical protein COW94_04710 [Candidatus Peregrinibacteria bacterium CG22_combo_CG10-13_8_21_14_all_44_10]|nr:MAG: hypothetical protein AUK45_03080 [Candidatus Peregrinibacteria bacterium CG2_30_44_17]PIP65877.1 MAG: hypothetical protein COW94_04710 [Candidatus Peregrinibacteria bacterium CG22_combo_CG10-13_8_21_14_all_44_10]PIS04515.1 MAG: hypothetical protein COT83_00135 [Candidatus Peregrinibacteria bacterium CG10_big_fil_rev_8_21_14_0_10_44_7]
MLWLAGIHIVSIIFTAITIWLMIRYIKRYELPREQYSKLWGFLRIRYVLVLYAVTTVAWAGITMGLFFLTIEA